MPYSLQEIADMYKGSRRSLQRRLKEIKDQGKFTKESPGLYYDYEEVKKLAGILNFPFGNGNPGNA